MVAEREFGNAIELKEPGRYYFVEGGMFIDSTRVKRGQSLPIRAMDRCNDLEVTREYDVYFLAAEADKGVTGQRH